MSYYIWRYIPEGGNYTPLLLPTCYFLLIFGAGLGGPLRWLRLPLPPDEDRSRPLESSDWAGSSL